MSMDARSNPERQIDSIAGCVLGGAIGDAYGLPYEGGRRVFPKPLHSLKISDDTQLTLATCEAIIEHNGLVSPEAIAARFASWHNASRITGMGASTYQALSALAQGGHWALVGRRGHMAAGNGAAMRIAPLAFCLDPFDSDDRRVIRDVARITHHSEEAYVGALAVVIAIHATYNKRFSMSNLLSLVAASLPDTQVRDRLIEIARLGDSTNIIDLGKKHGASGYVVESIPLALFSASQVETLSFQQIIKEIVSLGGDTDTIASITGQVVGAYIGRKNLPEEMISNLLDLELIEKTIYLFTNVICLNSK